MHKEIQKALASDPQKELVRAHNVIIQGRAFGNLGPDPCSLDAKMAQWYSCNPYNIMYKIFIFCSTLSVLK